jgi:hypothetical protein
MATRDEIKKAILEVAGHPETGVVRELVNKWADAIVDIDSPEAPPVVRRVDMEPIKETRVMPIAEKR